ncbi:MAG: hypothetical protein AAGD32_00635 [Planctomycetota bacterium]
MDERTESNIEGIPGWEALNLGERIVAVARRLAHEDLTQQLADCCKSGFEDEGEPAAGPLLLSIAVASRTLENERAKRGAA